MRYGSVCSGIEAATMAWHGLGWEPAFFSEIEAFPKAVLAHRYPETPCHGDFTTIGSDDYGAIDLLVGGTPCQSFSVAGLRKGMDDDRGNLALEFIKLIDRKRPEWVVWENVPGVLSSNSGKDFGSFLGALAEIGYGFAYRVLDAQYFGLAQRRKRVFVVGYLGDWRPPCGVLFERASFEGHSAPCRTAGEDVTGTLSARNQGGGGLGTDFECAGGVVTGPLRRSPYCDKASQETGLVVAYGRNNQSGPIDTAGALNAKGGSGRMDFETETFIAFDCKASAGFMGTPGPIAPTLRSMNSTTGRDNGGGQLAVASKTMIRRLTPRECERLMGFPDNYTLVPYRKKFSSNGPRYKALGNSMAVPVMRWIGDRIAMVEEVIQQERSAA